MRKFTKICAMLLVAGNVGAAVGLTCPDVNALYQDGKYISAMDKAGNLWEYYNFNGQVVFDPAQMGFLKAEIISSTNLRSGTVNCYYYNTRQGAFYSGFGMTLESKISNYPVPYDLEKWRIIDAGLITKLICPTYISSQADPQNCKYLATESGNLQAN